MHEADADAKAGRIVALEGVGVSYRKGRNALEGITMSVSLGEMVSVVGPNGGGKTTLVKLLVGSVAPTTGTVWRRQGLTLGYQPQRDRIDTSMPMTVGALLRLNTDCGDDEVAATLDALQFPADEQKRSVSTLSGGERQVAMIARAMLRNPDLLVLDEPGAFCDEGRLNVIYAVIHDYVTRRGCATVVVSHDLSRVLANTDRVICVNRRIMCEGGPEDVTHDDLFAEMFDAEPQTGIFHHRH